MDNEIIVFENATIIRPKNSNVTFEVNGEEKPLEVVDATPENVEVYFPKEQG